MQRFSQLLALLALAGSVWAQSGLGAARAIGVDLEQAMIPVEEILSGGPPPQGIPALGFSGDHAGAAGPTGAPQFATQDEAASWLGVEEPVIALTVAGESRAYPLQILTWHEIANDTLGGVPVAVTFCPLCNSALAFDRRVPLSDGARQRVLEQNSSATPAALGAAFAEAYEAQGGETSPRLGLEVTFGVSGLLYNANMLMFDSASSTLWSQLIGEGVVGSLAGTQLLRYPAQIVSFAEFRAAFPDALVLSRDTGFSRLYGNNPISGTTAPTAPPSSFPARATVACLPKSG